MKNSIAISAFCILLSTSLLGQKSTIYTHDNATYNSALELYDKEKFSAAQEQFAQVLKAIEDKKSEVTVNAMYYHALCGLELFNTDAENLLVEFIYAYPESPKVKLAYFHLGRYKFRAKKYDEALAWFAKIDPYDLSEEELAEYHFKKGYSYFMEEKYDEASKSLFEIKDSDNQYTSAARYYYAHIAYLQKKYEPSLQSFLSLSNDEKFGPIVPYYITQIYYLQEKYDEVISYAPALLDSAIAKRAAEISLILGDAYYRTKKYKEAIPYLERFHKEKAYLATRHDNYQLGYAYFKDEQHQPAVEWFKKSIAEDDSLSQTAHYHLAECYLKLGDKKYAKSSFRIASDLDFDPQIKEDALFSFAKISYELSMHPYNDAIIAFEEFINTYPKSTKLNDAYEFLVAVYFTTKNYKAALTSLENIKNMNAQLEEAYQKIAYYRGIELFNNRKYPDAILHFNKSDKYPINQKVKADNTYWRAEAHYRLNQYEASIAEYKNYLFEPEAIASNDVNKANYGIGYAYFKLKEYPNANQWFRKYVQSSGNEKSKIQNDVLNRIGDCFYIQKEYKAAIEYYDKATMLGLGKVDYSLYQSAVTNGVIGNHQEKNDLLVTLINRKEKTHLLDDAIFELGKIQLVLNKNSEALANFQLLIKDHPNSPYIAEALIKEGLIYYNQKNDDQALLSFKRVVLEYPKSEESNEAMQKIKKIYIDKGQLAAYEEYLTSVGGADSSALVMDADYFEVAENSYMSGDCNKAVNDLTKYLEKYPKGEKVLIAHFYKADCEYRSGFENEALMDFNYVIDQPKNKFTETALLKAGKINLNLGRTEDALNCYSKLEYLADVPANVFKAQVEQMRLNYQLGNYDETIKYCELIINKDIDDASLITESHLLYGKAAMAKDDYNKALTEFTTAAGSGNAFGAEAKYNMAYILYLRGEYDQCETEVFSLIKKFSSYDYWIGKALILLADNYVAKEDLFQAKVTLKNVIDNSKYPELVNTASEKLQIIEQQEAAQRVSPPEEDLDVKLFNVKDIKLFQEEEQVEEEILPQPEQPNNNPNDNEESEDE
ncbi:MAG: tetratricopeptide repeat protein [Flavobacteriales bacterium]|nr:tetratricopeptide repeat protein [Flavobacteriales bacterium]